ncbi:MAG: hypothetical protein WD036_00300 [Bauldia sp.]
MATEKDLHKDLEALRSDLVALTETVRRLVGDVAEARAGMREAVKSAAKDAAKGAAAAGEELLSDAMKLGGDAAGAAGDAAHATVASLEAEIRRNPISAVFTALGIGFVIGIIGRR